MKPDTRRRWKTATWAMSTGIVAWNVLTWSVGALWGGPSWAALLVMNGYGEGPLELSLLAFILASLVALSEDFTT